MRWIACRDCDKTVGFVVKCTGVNMSLFACDVRQKAKLLPKIF
jgi:hypothetical protein